MFLVKEGARGREGSTGKTGGGGNCKGKQQQQKQGFGFGDSDPDPTVEKKKPDLTLQINWIRIQPSKTSQIRIRFLP